MKYKFEPGVRAKDQDGNWYTTEAVSGRDGKIKIKYDTGKVAFLLAVLETTRLRESQEELQDALRQEQGDIRGSFNHWLRNDDYYTALGILAVNCYVLFQATSEMHIISELYKEFHNTILTQDTDGLYISECCRNEFRINFPKTLFASIPNLAFEALRLENKTDVCQINHNKWGRELIGLGFELGNKHNIDKIRSRIPAQFVEAFQLGVDVAQEMNQAKVEKSLFGAHTPVTKGPITNTTPEIVQQPQENKVAA